MAQIHKTADLFKKRHKVVQGYFLTVESKMCQNVDFQKVRNVRPHVLPMHIGYNHYRVGTKTISVEPRGMILLSMGPQKLNN